MNARNVGIEVDVIIDVNTSVFAFLNVRRVSVMGSMASMYLVWLGGLPREP